LTIVGITTLLNNENSRLNPASFASLVKGMVELIFGRKWISEQKADNEVDFSEIPVEFHEENASFDWQTF